MIGWLLASGLPMRLAAAATPRAGLVERHGLRYRAGPRGLLDLTLPAHAGEDTPLIVFFHGGGWRSGGRGDYVWLGRALARAGFAAAIPEYRLWPRGRWPDFLHDAAEAVAWLLRAGVAPARRVVVMGHSAGGFIGAALALDPRWLHGAGVAQGPRAFAGAVLLAAPIAWRPETEPTRSIFAAAPEGRIAAMPEDADLAAAPPLLLVHGTADTVVGRFHSDDLARAVSAAGGAARLHLMDGADHLAPMIALAEPARRRGWVRRDLWEAVTGFARG